MIGSYRPTIPKVRFSEG